MRPRTAAGRRLLDEFDAALAERGKLEGETLEWTLAETKTLELLGQTVDRLEGMRRIYGVEMRGDARPAVLVKLSAEQRALERQITTLMGEISLETGPEVTVKSPRHQKAAHSRWERAEIADRFKLV